MFYSGSIHPEENKTFVQYLDGMTIGQYTTVTWNYSIESVYIPNPLDVPIVYFRHVGQEDGFGTDKKCFAKTFAKNFAFDPRLVPLSKRDHIPGSDKLCTLFVSGRTTKVKCTGTIKIAVAFPKHFYASVGFRCGHQSPLNVSFRINITSFPDQTVPCTNWSQALDELEQPLPLGLLELVDTCTNFYAKFSTWNLIGLSQLDLKYMYMLTSQVFLMTCYKYIEEMACRVIFPECTNNTVILPCTKSCHEFNSGCSPYSSLNGSVKFNFSCTSLEDGNKTWPSPQHKRCVYRKIECLQEIKLPKNGKVVYANGTAPTSIRIISCFPSMFYYIKGSNTTVCGYNGVWHGLEETICDLIEVNVIMCAVIGSGIIIVILMLLVYRYRFEFRLLIYKYCPCWWLCCYCSHRNRAGRSKKYHAYIIYHEDLMLDVRNKIHEPLRYLGYNIAIDYDTIMPNDRTGTKVPEIISQSHRIIIVLNQACLDSDDCSFELEQAIWQSIEDRSLRFIVILMQSKTSLTNVPRWLKGYLRIKMFIDKNDPMFLTKLLVDLPPQSAIVNSNNFVTSTQNASANSTFENERPAQQNALANLSDLNAQSYSELDSLLGNSNENGGNYGVC